MAGAAVTYVRYAGLFLGVSVLAGLWLRAGLYHPPLLDGVVFVNLVHAHSHLAFYGWATMGLFGAMVAYSDPPAWTAPVLRVHAHVMALLSILAFVTFFRGGYSMESVLVSMGHVVGWLVFVGLAWPRGGRGSAEARPLFRLGLGFLALSGVATLAPLVVMIRGASSVWLDRFAIEIFLVPFVAGWLIVAALGAVYAYIGRVAPPRAALWALSLGVFPSSLAFPPGMAPLAWLPVAGRIGLAAVALGTGFMVYRVARTVAVPGGRDRAAVRDGRTGLVVIALTALGLKVLVDLAVASGIGMHLIHNHSMTVAYLHLALLGAVTTALIGSLTGAAGDRVRGVVVAVYAAGLVLMVGPLALMGSPAGLRLSFAAGLDINALLAVSLLGGVVLVAAVLPLAATLATVRLGAGVRAEPVRDEAGNPGVRNLA
jgi:hypothetical protein